MYLRLPRHNCERVRSPTHTEIEAVPFAKLLKARRAMREKRDDPSAVDDDTLRVRREAAKQQLRNMDVHKPAPSKDTESKRRAVLEAREHKSAPTVMSSRRPVSRARQVVEPIQHEKRRDPRFDSLSAGPVNLDLLGKSYKFLPELYETELKSLRDTHSKLKRMEAHHAGPHAKSEQALRIREERQNVELALRRAESQRNERLRRDTERSVKSNIKKENQRRVDAGLRPYFPKKGMYRYLPSRARGPSAAPQVRAPLGWQRGQHVDRRQKGYGAQGAQRRPEGPQVARCCAGRWVAYRPWPAQPRQLGAPGAGRTHAERPAAQAGPPRLIIAIARLAPRTDLTWRLP